MGNVGSTTNTSGKKPVGSTPTVPSRTPTNGFEAQSLQILFPQSYKTLNDALSKHNLANLADKICIATHDLAQVSLEQGNIDSLIMDIERIAALPTGQNTLQALNELLQDDAKLVISFVNEEKSSPITYVRFFIIKQESTAQKEWASQLIRMPERYEDCYELPFYDPQKNSIV